MAKVKKAAAPSDADTVIRALRDAFAAHGWVTTSSQVDQEGSVLVSGKAVPPPEPDDTE